MNRVWASFDRFFFESCDPRVAPWLRIGYGLLLICNVVVWLLDDTYWFSNAGVLQGDTARDMTFNLHGTLLQTYDDPMTVRVLLGIMLLQSVLLTVGVWSRLQAGCLFFWLVTIQHRNPMIIDGEDVLFRWFALLFVLLPLDHQYSLGRWYSGRKSLATASHAWAMRLVQIQVAVVFFSSAWCKLLGETWRNGSALASISRLGDYFGRLEFLGPLMDLPWVVRGLTWGTIAIELIVPIVIWIPRFHRAALLTAVALHVSIELTMNLFLFQWIMLVGWLAFVDPTKDFAGIKDYASIRRLGTVR